jgi:hypothetical protein
MAGETSRHSGPVSGRALSLPGGSAGKPARLFHYSEDPRIELFEPRGGGRAIPGRPDGEKLVWAIDERHAPMYLFPRECPRIILWAYEDSAPEDIERWMGGSNARMAAHIETSWLERLSSCRLYRYTFDSATFESIGDHGVHVSPVAAPPLSVEPAGELREALVAAGVELRALDSLQPLAEAWHSSLHFSGIRLRNAAKWTAPV